MNHSPRRWFQFHLLTAIVMMFVAGGFIWSNCIEECVDDHYDEDPSYYTYEYGWPASVFSYDKNSYGTFDVTRTSTFPLGIVENLAVLIPGLLLAAACCEWAIRRRDRIWNFIRPRQYIIRFRLSTLLIANLTIGGLLWLNLDYGQGLGLQIQGATEPNKSMGWPRLAFFEPNGLVEILVGDFNSQWKSPFKCVQSDSPEVYWLWLVPDLIANGSVLIGVVVISELLARWLTRKKPILQPLSDHERTAAEA